jgi:hypothetical protein
MAAKRKRGKIEFSKRLALIVTRLFVASIIFSFITWYFEDRVPLELLAYVAAPFSIVVSGYFIKAGSENKEKISQAQTKSEFNEEEY